MSESRRIQHITVIIPAHNEEHLIGRCLDAVAEAASNVNLSVTVLVALDNCRDATGEIAASRGARSLVVHEGSVGAARRSGIAAVMAGIDVSPNRLWIANTDADSTVPADWLTTHVRLAECGAEVVTGLVVPDRSDLSRREWRRWSALHPIRAGHAHVYGANLGLRADTYLRAGGFPRLDSGEDRALVDTARTLGAEIVATAEAIVTTSGRINSRAPRGFSAWLHQTKPPAGQQFSAQ